MQISRYNITPQVFRVAFYSADELMVCLYKRIKVDEVDIFPWFRGSRCPTVDFRVSHMFPLSPFHHHPQRNNGSSCPVSWSCNIRSTGWVVCLFLINQIILLCLLCIYALCFMLVQKPFVHIPEMLTRKEGVHSLSCFCTGRLEILLNKLPCSVKKLYVFLRTNNTCPGFFISLSRGYLNALVRW